MKRRHGIAVSILFLLPLALVLVFAVLALRDRDERVRLRAGDGALRRLDALSDRMQEAAAEWEAVLLELCAPKAPDPEVLRGLSDGHPWVRQAFWLDPQGNLLFPDTASAGLRETEFLARSELLLAAGVPGSASEAPGPERAYGWSSYWWREGSQWVFWCGHGDDGYMGLELNRYALLGDLFSRLEISLPNDLDETRYRLALNDDQGRIFALWGSWEPEEDRRPLAALRLAGVHAGPLSGWTLSFHADEAAWAEGSKASAAAVVVGIVGFAAAALALGLYAFRGFAEELRTAGQRVSFVNQVSHELKSPLTNIRLYAELLARRLPEAGPEREYLDVIEREGRRLSRLINNVLTFGREGRASAEALNLRPESLDRLVSQAADAFKPTFEDKGIVSELHLSAPGIAMIDADLVDQVVGNLLSNAEKYAASGKRVLAETGRTGDHLWVRVKDYGPGIRVEDRPRLFRQFERFNVGVTEAVGGTGLGLYLSRRLARRHGGDLILEDSDRGCSFLLTLRDGDDDAGAGGRGGQA